MITSLFSVGAPHSLARAMIRPKIFNLFFICILFSGGLILLSDSYKPPLNSLCSLTTFRFARVSKHLYLDYPKFFNRLVCGVFKPRLFGSRHSNLQDYQHPLNCFEKKTLLLIIQESFLIYFLKHPF
jgi:hypothetical protein